MEHLKHIESAFRAGFLRRLPPAQWLAWLLCLGFFVCMAFAAFLLCAACVSCSSPVSGLCASEADGLPVDYFRMELPAGGQPGGGTSSGGDLLRLFVSPDFGEGKELYLPGGQGVLLEFRKNRPAAVLAYPSGAARPSGAIYPYTAVLEEKDGFAAELLWELYHEGGTMMETEREHVRLFNWHKLLEALRELDDPWLLDSGKIKEAIRAGKFSKSKLKKWVKTG